MQTNRRAAHSRTIAILTALALVLGFAGALYLIRGVSVDPLRVAGPGLESLGASLQKVTVTSWVPADEGSLQSAADRVADALGARPAALTAAAEAPGPGNERRVYQVSGLPGATLVLTLHRTTPATLAALLDVPAPAPSWWAWRSRLSQALTPASTDGKLRTYTVLEYAGSGDRLWSQRRWVASAVLRRLGARPVEGIDDGELYSITAYSPRMRERLMVAGRAVNTAVALHWDAANQRSILWLGSPVINIEY